MDFNSILFPAPTDDKYDQIENNKGHLLFVPKYKDDHKLFHIPCMYQETQFRAKSNKVFLYFHGNAEDIFNATTNVSVIKSSLPFNTICMEYPGYSIYYEEKSAETIENDSLILFDFLTNECKVNNKDIVICGRSIGTGPATYLASKRKPGALILISPIKSIRDTVKNLIGPMQYLIRDRFNNYDRISGVTCPLLIIHGQKDSLIPYEDSIKLSEKTSGPYELVLPENMNHNDVHIYDDFLEPITSFLKRHHMLNYKKEKINIDEKYFEFPDYLKNKGDDLNNNDMVSNLVRKLLNI
jgi:acetyl esterase/lipase